VEAEEDVVVVDAEEEVEVEEEEAGVVAEDGTIATTISTMVLQGTTIVLRGTTIVLQGTTTILNRKPHHRCLVWKRRTNELPSPNNEMRKMGKGMLRGGKIGRAYGDLKDMFHYWGGFIGWFWRMERNGRWRVYWEFGYASDQPFLACWLCNRVIVCSNLVSMMKCVVKEFFQSYFR
jgi:hypothetical protein